jgi:hypothetical protein
MLPPHSRIIRSARTPGFGAAEAQRLCGLALPAPAVLHFYLAYRIAVAVESDREAGGPPSPGPPTLGR